MRILLLVLLALALVSAQTGTEQPKAPAPDQAASITVLQFQLRVAELQAQFQASLTPQQKVALEQIQKLQTDAAAAAAKIDCGKDATLTQDQEKKLTCQPKKPQGKQ